MLNDEKVQYINMKIENYLSEYTEKNIFSGRVYASIEDNIIIKSAYGKANYN